MIAKGLKTTGPVLIYAVGGGLGHAVRGLCLQSLLREEGRESLVLVRDTAFGHPQLPAEGVVQPYRGGSLQEFSSSFDCLLVDTFPQGWQEEFSDEALLGFSERIFLARYQKRFDWHLVRKFYQRILFPYPMQFSEWGDLAKTGEFCGHVLREKCCRWVHETDDLVLIDSGGRTSQQFHEVLRSLCRAQSRTFRIVDSYSPNDEIFGAKFLFVGAGYNTFYEVLRQNVDARFLPLLKRYDDQKRRVQMFRKGLFSLGELKDWLAQRIPVQLSPAEV